MERSGVIDFTQLSLKACFWPEKRTTYSAKSEFRCAKFTNLGWGGGGGVGGVVANFRLSLKIMIFLLLPY